MTQQANLKRVAARIAPAVEQFLRNRLRIQRPVFTMSELHSVVRITGGPSAPDSPGRILRALRDAGKVDYRVIDRARSRYEVLSA